MCGYNTNPNKLVRLNPIKDRETHSFSSCQDFVTQSKKRRRLPFISFTETENEKLTHPGVWVSGFSRIQTVRIINIDDLYICVSIISLSLLAVPIIYFTYRFIIYTTIRCSSSNSLTELSLWFD